ncbi:MAG TPA: DUF4292 domain-containing protein [Cytophagales bacterium]|nr:DUF4292 domain-containing protein [Cytophagales bacterium]
MNKALIKVLPILLLLVIGCKRKNIPQTSSVNAVNSTSDFTINNTDFLYFTSKSNFNYQDNDENISATANLRMKKDSILWINITPGLGIEAMRAIITPDSIVIVDKIKKRYVSYDFATLSEKYNFNITFNLIQDLILGNQVKELSDSDRVVKEVNVFVLTQKIKNSLVESYINQSTAKLERVEISEPGTSNQFVVVYGNNSISEEGKNIPNSISMDLDYTYQNKKYTVTINIDHQKTEFLEKGLKFPFNIPAKYERIE